MWDYSPGAVMANVNNEQREVNLDHSNEVGINPDDDVIVETYASDEEYLFDDESLEDDGNEDSFKIPRSSVIDALPDCSVATAVEAADTVCCIAAWSLSPTVVLIAAGSTDEVLRCYVSEGSILQLIKSFDDFTDSVVDVAFSHDGKYLAGASYDSTVHLYKVEVTSAIAEGNYAGIQINSDKILEGPTRGVEWLQWHPKGYVLVAGSEDATVWMWRVPSGIPLGIFSGHAASVSCGTFADNGKLIVTGCVDGSVIIWNPKTAGKIASYSPAGTTKHAASSWLHKGPITCIAAHPTRPLVATASEDSTIRVVHVSASNTSIVGTLRGHTDTIESLSFLDSDVFLPEEVLLASGSLDGSVRIWSCSRFTMRSCFKHEDLACSVSSEPTEAPTASFIGGVTRVVWACTSQTTYVISTSTDSTIRVWDVRDGSCFRVLSGHKDIVLGVSVVHPTEDGDASSMMTLVSCSDDKTVKIWRMNSREQKSN